MIGTLLGPFKVVGGISAGAISTVCRSCSPSMDPLVMAKTTNVFLMCNDEAVAWFQPETRLEHLHIPPVYDSDGARTAPYIVTRHLEDGTIRDVLSGRALPLTEVAFLIQQVGQALHSLKKDCQIPVELSPAGWGPSDSH